MSSASRLAQAWLARLRGEQTLERARKAGLRAPGSLYIGTRVYIDHGFAWAVTIGARTTIAHDARIVAHDASIKHLTGYTIVQPVTIGERCYIGAGAIVLPGTTIGDGAIIEAGAIVRGAIPAESVAAGNPVTGIVDTTEFPERHLGGLVDPGMRTERSTLDGFAEHDVADMRRVLAERGQFYVR